MGLEVVVGILADLHEVDEEGFDDFKLKFDAVNKALRANGLPKHREPVGLKGARPWAISLLGYYGLHYLRRIAAHLEVGQDVPPPGSDSTVKDSVVEKYYSDHEKSKAGVFSRLHKKKEPKMRFDHLMLHSDSEGFYLPMEFEEVITPDPSLGVPGGNIGSSHKLRKECMRLAKALEIPSGLDPKSVEVLEAGGYQGEGEAKWERYGIESHTCLALLHASHRSIRLGAAIVFM